MSISIKRYVDIQSGVGAAVTVAQRDLIGRLFTSNPKVPADAVIEFDTLDDVALYFGGVSEEYKRAAFYFGFVSKSISSPRKLSFARWAKVASEARIYGGKVTATVADFVAIGAAGSISILVGGQEATVTTADFTGDVSFADVAASLQLAIRAEAGSQFVAATVTYDAGTGSFIFASTEQEAAAISISAPGNLAAPLGWTTAASPDPVFSPGVDLTPIPDALTASVGLSNNFGSFAFVDDLSNDEAADASAWNAARNVEFMFSVGVADLTAAATLVADVSGNGGTAITVAPDAGEYDELVPMAVLAATNYDLRNSAQNYMFQKANLTPKVATNAEADSFDQIRVNYYGVTQTAGQLIAFYQRGVLMGTDTSPLDMNTYANEIWLKDAAQSAIMGLLLALPRVPANAEGRGQVMAILQDPIDRALRNGVISVGKPLTVQQKVFVGQVTGDPLAFHQVQTIGYWLDAVVEPFVGEGGNTEFRIIYVLVYSKDDAVRKVEGTHVLI